MHRHRRRTTRILGQALRLLNRALPAAAALVAALAPCACERAPRALDLRDLTPGELRYVTRVVVLERARAAALVDPAAGGALLDSLAAAWGDSSLERTLDDAPTDPLRAARVADLLARVLTADRDGAADPSAVPRPADPLPDPAPAAAGEPAEDPQP